MKKIDIKELEERVRRKEDLTGIDLRGCDLRGAQLPGALMEGAMLRYANLTDANLEGATLVRANLRHSVLVRANLKNANLKEADLSYADLSGACVLGANFAGSKMFSVKGVSDKVFFRTSTLEWLLDKGKAKFEGDLLKLVEEKKTYRLTESVRFLEVVEGKDEERLVGRVKSIDELKKMGCEIMSGSVILGETVYNVEQGFLGIPARDAKEVEKSDVEMLIEYFLKGEKSSS